MGCFTNIFSNRPNIEEITIFNTDEKQAELKNLVGDVCNILIKEGKEGLATKLAKGEVGIRLNLIFGKDYLFITSPFDNKKIDLKNYDLISKGNQLIYLNKDVPVTYRGISNVIES